MRKRVIASGSGQLNLSFQFESFRCIASKYDVSDLTYLNLSGCINVSSHGMNLFVDLCQLLNGENLYYCDNIDDGPLGTSANGCENLGCGKKFCCRSGR